MKTAKKPYKLVIGEAQAATPAETKWAAAPVSQQITLLFRFGGSGAAPSDTWPVNAPLAVTPRTNQVELHAQQVANTR